MAKQKRSTDSQTVENQIRELSLVAGRRGWQVVEAYGDVGISGAKGRDQRPGLDTMLKDVNRAADDSQSQTYNAAFLQGLQQFGWTVGRNILIEYRYGSADGIHIYAAELVALAPDVILVPTSLAVQALQQVTRTIPIVFVQVIDPVGGGFAESLAHPGGNATGFTVFEYSIRGKWIELLKEIAPHITRAAVTRNPNSIAQVGMLGAMQSVAQSLGVELRPIEARDAGEIERAISAFAHSGNAARSCRRASCHSLIAS